MKNNTTKYTKQYFLDKFTAIPEGEIGSNGLINRCVLYHLGVTADKKGKYVMTDEAIALADLLGYEGPSTRSHFLWSINDNAQFTNTTPKKAILEALKKVVDKDSAIV